eukprot:2918489-Pleurochrysis_carterae.AAC.1
MGDSLRTPSMRWTLHPPFLEPASQTTFSPALFGCSRPQHFPRSLTGRSSPNLPRERIALTSEENKDRGKSSWSDRELIRSNESTRWRRHASRNR